MNLVEPPASKLPVWIARHTRAVVDYCKAVFQLSKLKARLTYDGVTHETAISYTGRNAELNVNLDFIELGTPCILLFPNVPIDGTTTPFADEATATAAMADQVVSCLIETTPASTLASLTATVVSRQLVVADSLAFPDYLGRAFLCGATIKAAGGVAIDFVFTLDVPSFGDLVTAELFDDAMSSLDTYSAGATYSGTINFTIPADGTYYIHFSAAQGPGAATTMSLAVNVRSAKRITFCSLGAQWDDGIDTGIVYCT